MPSATRDAPASQPFVLKRVLSHARSRSSGARAVDDDADGKEDQTEFDECADIDAGRGLGEFAWRSRWPACTTARRARPKSLAGSRSPSSPRLSHRVPALTRANAPKIPTRAAGSTTWIAVSQFVAPSANEASRCSRNRGDDIPPNRRNRRNDHKFKNHACRLQSDTVDRSGNNR